jgi:hypothetical protein
VNNRKKLTNEMLKAATPYMLKLLAGRVEMYKKGIPPAALAESKPTAYLSDTAVWRVLTPEQQKQSMQLMSDLLALMGEQAATASPTDFKELSTAIRSVAAGMSVAAAQAGDKALEAALVPATKISAQTSAAGVKQMITPVWTELSKSTRFPGLTPPPAVQGNAPAPAPASAPTSGPVSVPGLNPTPTPGTPGTPGTGTTPAKAPGAGTTGGTGATPPKSSGAGTGTGTTPKSSVTPPAGGARPTGHPTGGTPKTPYK